MAKGPDTTVKEQLKKSPVSPGMGMPAGGFSKPPVDKTTNRSRDPISGPKPAPAAKNPEPKNRPLNTSGMKF